MSEDVDFEISKNTLEKLLYIKNKFGFSKNGWNELFNFLIKDQPVEKNELEEIMEDVYYKNYYEDWVKQFALNLKEIWKEDSANELIKLQKSDIKNAIVIGRGPSLAKHNHLRLLAESNFSGKIICCDSILVKALESGVTPDRFPDFYVTTIDTTEEQTKYYDHPIVDKFGKQIKGIFSTVVFPETVERARRAGIKIYWLHALFDYQEGKKSFNQISAIMVRVKKSRGLPAIQTSGNVGAASWFISWRILKCRNIAIIGLDHAWSKDDPWEKIISHGNRWKKIDIQDDVLRQKLFPEVYNPDFNCHCILDPLWQYYVNAFTDFIARAPLEINTINATEGGAIFGKRIKGMRFIDFLKHYEQ